jgi:hypothetical protein
MATELSSFHRPLRIILGDLDQDVHIYDDDQLTAAMELVLNLGKVPGYAVGDSGEITPDLTPSSDSDSAKAFALLLFHAAKRFVAALTRSAYRTRAFAESFGESRELVDDILNEVYDLENGVKLD